MQIGQLATQAGVAIDTVRYYERQGLLPPPERRASGYRQYGQPDIARLRFIRRAKELGFSLQEIQDLLRLSGQADADRRVIERGEAAFHRQRLAIQRRHGYAGLERTERILKPAQRLCVVQGGRAQPVRDGAGLRRFPPARARGRS